MLSPNFFFHGGFSLCLVAVTVSPFGGAAKLSLTQHADINISNTKLKFLYTLLIAAFKSLLKKTLEDMLQQMLDNSLKQELSKIMTPLS